MKLSGLADDIGKLGGLAAALTFFVLSMKELYFIFNVEGHAFHAKPFLDFVIVAVTIVVVAIPEGLPLAVTIALAYSMNEMMADNCLVRVMASCETMGGADCICSDKTGILSILQILYPVLLKKMLRVASGSGQQHNQQHTSRLRSDLPWQSVFATTYVGTLGGLGFRL